MRRAILFAAGLSCLIPMEEAEAQCSEMTFTGAQLLKACITADYEWIGFCNGYLQAAFDANGGRGICAPKGITRNQVFDTVLPNLMKSDLLQLNAFVVIDVILHKAFPCN